MSCLRFKYNSGIYATVCLCSHALQEQISHAKFPCCSRPKFHALSNGALVFAVSLILCTEKLIKLFTETVLAFNLHFQNIGINLQENKVHHSK